ncbi:hypothetical protein EMCRGX_G006799 [Ephydatia muelleri]
MYSYLSHAGDNTPCSLSLPVCNASNESRPPKPATDEGQLVANECTSGHLLKIALFNFDWRRVGRRLLASQQNITDICREEPDEPNRREAVLMKWQSQKGSSATYSVLAEAFKTIGYGDIAEKAWPTSLMSSTETSAIVNTTGLSDQKDYFQKMLTKWLTLAPPQHPIPTTEALAEAIGKAWSVNLAFKLKKEAMFVGPERVITPENEFLRPYDFTNIANECKTETLQHIDQSDEDPQVAPLQNVTATDLYDNECRRCVIEE